MWRLFVDKLAWRLAEQEQEAKLSLVYKLQSTMILGWRH